MDGSGGRKGGLSPAAAEWHQEFTAIEAGIRLATSGSGDRYPRIHGKQAFIPFIFSIQDSFIYVGSMIPSPIIRNAVRLGIKK